MLYNFDPDNMKMAKLPAICSLRPTILLKRRLHHSGFFEFSDVLEKPFFLEHVPRSCHFVYFNASSSTPIYVFNVNIFYKSFWLLTWKNFSVIEWKIIEILKLSKKNNNLNLFSKLKISVHQKTIDDFRVSLAILRIGANSGQTFTIKWSSRQCSLHIH